MVAMSGRSQSGLGSNDPLVKGGFQGGALNVCEKMRQTHAFLWQQHLVVL
jgi:hypothetical protein